MTYKGLKELAIKHDISVRSLGSNYWSPVNGEVLFNRLLDANIIPACFRDIDYHDYNEGDLGCYSTAENNCVINNRELEFNSFGAIEFLNDLYHAFYNTDYVLDEFHVISEKSVTAIVVSKTDTNNKLNLRATMEGWLILNGEKE